jgi:ubiquinone/menaquinone biosynthesis C-methylase UbiE
MICTRVINHLLKDKTLSTSDTVLSVCGGATEHCLFLAAGFTNVTISNLDEQDADRLDPYRWSHQDAENLTYPDNSFDVVFVHAGLHHCYSPHRALLEMYRVARRVVIVSEARDSVAMRAANRFGFAADYEIEAVSANQFLTGGAGNGPIPNFVYRWTESEVFKTVRSFEPRYRPRVRFFYGLRLPYERFRSISRPALRMLLNIFGPVAELFAKVFPKQGNEFAFVILKQGKLHPWLLQDGDGKITLSQETVGAMGRIFGSGK